MQNILNPTDYHHLLQRLHALSADAHRLWGSMHAEAMLWHLRSQLELALGQRKTNTSINSYLKLPPFRWLALYVIPWPKGSATAPEMNVKRAQPDLLSFEVEKQMLIACLEQVGTTEHLQPHPLFGSLSKKDWGRLIWKHVDHHLRQFGV
ncbi:MAG: DUF1569 domain-containing protein [Bacteroidetes bacterium]|nr:DUF1569 domain-containing protein [Bacteroidota bacterium]